MHTRTFGNCHPLLGGVCVFRLFLKSPDIVPAQVGVNDFMGKGGENGTFQNPYTIDDREDLVNFRNRVNGQGYTATNFSNLYIKLTNDIDMGGVLNGSWSSIGNTATNYFGGTFDGDGHTITDLYCTGTSNGFFGFVSGASIRNVKFDTVNIISTNTVSVTGTQNNPSHSNAYAGVGAVVGLALQSGTTSLGNVHVTACTLAYNTQAGSYNTFAGGIVGIAMSSSFEMNKCSFSGSVETRHTNTQSSFGAGGLVGEIVNLSTATIYDCLVYNSAIKSQGGATNNYVSQAGGIVGAIQCVINVSIRRCVVTRNTSVISQNPGGTNQQGSASGVIGRVYTDPSKTQIVDNLILPSLSNTAYGQSSVSAITAIHPDAYGNSVVVTTSGNYSYTGVPYTASGVTYYYDANTKRDITWYETKPNIESLGIFNLDNIWYFNTTTKHLKLRGMVATYSITYHLNDGAYADGADVSTTYNVLSPDPVVLPNAVRDYYTFGGWYTTSNFLGSAVTSFSVADSEYKTFYAKWVPVSYAITYHLAGGESHVGVPPLSYTNTVETPDNVVLGAAYKGGHTFAGWYADVYLSGDPVVSFPKTDAVAKNFFAKFTANTLTILYDDGGGSGSAPIAPISAAFGETVVVPANTYMAPVGEKFSCWTVFVGGVATNTTLLAGGTVLATNLSADLTNGNATVTLRATWVPQNSFTVSYHYNDGEAGGAMTEYYLETTPAGTVYQLPPAVRAGHTFKGWFTRADFLGVAVEYFTVPEPKVNFDFYAKWQINTFTATFVSGGGSAVANQTIDWNETIFRPADPKRDGHIFDGWWTESDFETEFDFNVFVTRDFEIYAKWVINTHTITFDTGEAGIVIDPLVVEWGTVISAPDPAPEFVGHTFNGWCLDEAFENLYGFSAPVTGDFTLWAKWTIYNFWVLFETNGGSAVDMQYIDYGGAIAVPVDPTRAGHTFDGWWTDEFFETEFDFSVIVMENYTAYAKWIIHIHTVTFETFDGSAVDGLVVEWGMVISMPEPPELFGFIFAGWWDETFENLYDFTAPVTADICLYAKWDTPPPPVTHWYDGVLVVAKKYGTVQNAAIAGGSMLAFIILIIFLRGVPKRKMKKLKTVAGKLVSKTGKDLIAATQLVSDYKFNREDTALQQKTMDALRAVKREMSQTADAVGAYKKYKTKHSKRPAKGEKNPPKTTEKGAKITEKSAKTAEKSAENPE
jgi:uncharacterized repeat protein (TIGR02543 family)